jgi:hypothetical protein
MEITMPIAFWTCGKRPKTKTVLLGMMAIAIITASLTIASWHQSL